MTAGGGTSHTGQKHYYYICHGKRKSGCRKSSENKNTLEYTVANAVFNFLSRRENTEIAAQDTINYYEQRTSESSLRSIEARIRRAQDEAEELTNAFILARNDMLRAIIEKKMTEQEILLKDLFASKAQIELERGQKITKEKIIDFITQMLKGDPKDKGYQKILIDNLVYKVFVYDDHIITYLTFGNDKEIKEISLADNDKAITDKGVQPLSSMVPLVGACAGAKLFEHEPRPQEHTKKRTHLAGLRFEPPKRRIEKNTPEGVFFSMVPLVGACAGAKLFEHEPRPQEHTKKRTCLAGLRFEPPKRHIEKAPLKKGMPFLWCRWSDSNRHGIATTGF